MPLSFEVKEPITSAICNCGLTDNPPYCSGAHVDIE
jgi:CDGSH-type Zn-finger protein